MTVSPCSEMELLVQADVDGELDAPNAAALARHVAGCPGCAALQAELVALSGQLKEGVTRHAAPASLRAAVARSSKTENAQSMRPRWTLGAAFGAGFAIAASLALVVLPIRQQSLPEVVAAHIRGLQPGHLTDVESSDQHTVKPWFNGRLDFSPPVRDLAAQGFPLIGGRLDVLENHPVAVLVYRRDKHLIDVFIAPGQRQPPGGEDNGYNVISWAQGGMTFQAISDLNSRELGQFTQLLRAPVS